MMSHNEVRPSALPYRRAELPWFVLAVVVSTLITCVGEFAGFRVTVVGWSVTLVASLFLLLLRVWTARPLYFVLWLPWLLYLACQYTVADQPHSTVRTVLMACPIITGVAASSLRLSDDGMRMLLLLLKRSSVVLVLIVLLKALMGAARDQFFLLAPESITAVLLGTIFATQFVMVRRKAALAWWSLLATIPVASVARMATIAIGSVLPLSAAPLKLWWRIAIVLLALLGGVAVFYSASFQEKTFFAGSGSVSDIFAGEGVIRTSGRALMWAALWRGLPDALVFGHGTNASEAVVNAIVPNVAHPHNDFLRIAYDFGLFGVVLYAGSVLAQAVVLFRVARRLSGVARLIAYSAVTAFVPYTLLMMSDNVLLYAAYFGNLHYLLIGLCFGAASDETPHRTASPHHPDRFIPPRGVDSAADDRAMAPVSPIAQNTP